MYAYGTFHIYTYARARTRPPHMCVSAYTEKTRLHFRFGTFHHKFNRSCRDFR